MLRKYRGISVRPIAEKTTKHMLHTVYNRSLVSMLRIDSLAEFNKHLTLHRIDHYHWLFPANLTASIYTNTISDLYSAAIQIVLGR